MDNDKTSVSIDIFNNVLYHSLLPSPYSHKERDWILYASLTDAPDPKVWSMAMDAPKISQVESLAQRIENRRANRIAIPFSVRQRLLENCRAIARKKGLSGRIPLEDLKVLHEEAKKESANHQPGVLQSLGAPDETLLYEQVLARAVDRVENEVKHDFFYYQDFNFFFTRLISRYPLLNNVAFISLSCLVGFYIMTPIFFCYIVSDDAICPKDESTGGWLTALYFGT